MCTVDMRPKSLIDQYVYLNLFVFACFTQFVKDVRLLDYTNEKKNKNRMRMMFAWSQLN